ncbi:MAG: hypothetical protein ACKO4A_19300, partial [Gammaproteobacteria bacterium]
ASGVTVTVSNVKAVLGFGVSNGQDRYIRYDLTGAKFAAAVGSTNIQADSNVCAVANSNLGTATETLATGGAAKGTSVIFQITATANAGLAPTQNTCLSLGTVTLTSAAGASLRYSLYSSPSDAVNGTSTGRLATSSASIASTASGFDVTVTPATTVVDVSTSYKKFVADAGITSVSNTAIGAFGMDAVTGVLNLSNVQVAVSDLISNANASVTGSDFTPAGNTGVFFSTSANCVSAPAVTVAGTVVSSTVRNLNGLGNATVSGNVCFIANQNNAIAEQTFTVALDVTPAAGATTADIGATTLGNFDRNGTVLKAPLMEGKAGQSTWIQVVNVSSTAAPWAINCFGPSGSLGAGASGTLAAGQTGKLFYNNLGCAAGANAVEIVVSAPEGNVVGAFVRQSTTTGDSGIDSLTGNK